jgi:hypothetical protein
VQFSRDRAFLPSSLVGPRVPRVSIQKVMVTVLKYFFRDSDDFDVMQDESRGEGQHNESRPDAAVLKIISRPGGSPYAYDYCMVESKKVHADWRATEDQLSRHCGGTENESGLVYGIIHIGLYVQFFSANGGVLQPPSNALHLRNKCQRSYKLV